MRVLLKEGAEQATAETIVVVEPNLIEASFETLSGVGVLDGGTVVEVENSALADLIEAVVEKRAARGITAKRLIKEVAWMARVVSPYEVGSRVVQHITHNGCVIDKRQARAMPYSSLTPEERGNATRADEREDYGSLASRLGRLGGARDATAQRLEEMERSPKVRPVDRWPLEKRLDSYDRELVELRGELLASTRGSSG